MSLFPDTNFTICRRKAAQALKIYYTNELLDILVGHAAGTDVNVSRLAVSMSSNSKVFYVICGTPDAREVAQWLDNLGLLK